MRRNCPATALAHPSGGRKSCAAGCGGWGLLYFIFLFLVTDCTLYSVSPVQTRAISTRTLASQAKSSSAKCSCRIGFPRAHHQHERQRQRCQMVRGSGADGDFHRTRFAPRKLSSTFQRKQQLKLCLWLAVPVAGLIPPGSRTLRLQVDQPPHAQGLGVMQITPIVKVKVIAEVD